MTDLKPCPFCGGEADMFESVTCNYCKSCVIFAQQDLNKLNNVRKDKTTK